MQPPYGPGPARIDVKKFHFQEAGQETEVDLELSGTATDLSYDHFSGEFTGGIKTVRCKSGRVFQSRL